MLKLHPEILMKNGKKEFVVLTYEEFVALQERLADEGELLGFADTEPIQALQAILEHRPPLIVLERLGSGEKA